MRAMLLAITLLVPIAASIRVETASIEGLVVRDGTDTSRPLANARVELFDGPSPRIARTDGGGRFTLTNVEPGSYRLLVTKDGFIRQEYGQRTPNGPHFRIELAPAQRLSDLIFMMQPAPTITGWVRDEYGEVTPGALIQAYRKGYDARGKRTVVPLASTLSDDRGQYRLYWLDPGDYIVSGGSASPPAPVYLQTYYPGFEDPGNAETIPLRAGREVRGVDFKMVRGTPAKVGGSVVSRNGGFTGATVTLTPPGDVASPARYQTQALASGNLAREGMFALENVLPGTYIVFATQTMSRQRYSGYSTITVRNGRLGIRYDVRVGIGPALDINGSLAAEPESAADWSKTRVALTSLEPVLPSAGAVPVRADGTFSVIGVPPGDYMVTVTDLPEDAYIKSVRYGQKDLVDGALEIESDSTPGNLEVRVGLGGGAVDGVVLDALKRPRFGAQVVLVPDGVRRGGPDQYRIVTSDVDGRFAVRGIPPGNYRAFAWEVLEPFAYLDADFIRNYEEQGTSLRVVEGRRSAIQLLLIPEDR